MMGLLRIRLGSWRQTRITVLSDYRGMRRIVSQVLPAFLRPPLMLRLVRRFVRHLLREPGQLSKLQL